VHRTRRVLHAAEQHRAQERDDQKGGGWKTGTSGSGSHDMMVWRRAPSGKCRVAPDGHQGMRMPGMCSCPSGCFGFCAGLGAGFAGALRAGFAAAGAGFFADAGLFAGAGASAGAGFAAVESWPVAGAAWSIAP
jgi:hypothetical protein